MKTFKDCRTFELLSIFLGNTPIIWHCTRKIPSALKSKIEGKLVPPGLGWERSTSHQLPTGFPGFPFSPVSVANPPERTGHLRTTFLNHFQPVLHNDKDSDPLMDGFGEGDQRRGNENGASDGSNRRSVPGDVNGATMQSNGTLPSDLI